MRRHLAQMRWNLTWYIPFAAGLVVLALINARNGYRNSLILLHQHWKALGFLLSPSAYVWLIVNVVSVCAPVQMAVMIPGFLGPSDGCRNWRRSLAMWIAGFLALMALLQVIDWGSFPLVKQPDGSLYMRMIPFL